MMSRCSKRAMPSAARSSRPVCRASSRRIAADLVAWYAATLAHLGVDVRLNTRADKALLDSLKPQTVFVAEGSTPRTLALPGADGRQCGQRAR
ncbi:MAG: hypothetical protein ACLR1P_10110 [Oscillospiraceae bacterium]